MKFKYKIKQLKNGKYYAEYKFHKYLPYKKIKEIHQGGLTDFYYEITKFDSIKEAYNYIMDIYTIRIKDDAIKNKAKQFNKEVVENTISNKDLAKWLLKE